MQTVVGSEKYEVLCDIHRRRDFPDVRDVFSGPSAMLVDLSFFESQWFRSKRSGLEITNGY